MGTFRFSFLSILLILAYAVPSVASPASDAAQAYIAPEELDYPLDTGASLGQGFDIAQDHVKFATCVAGVPLDRPDQDTVLSMYSTHDASNAFRETDVSASAQADFLVGGASAKVQYIASQSYSQAESYFTVNERVESYSYYVADASKIPNDLDPGVSGLTLTPYALNLAEHDLSQFNKVCGDGFVLTIIQGGELIGTVTIDANTSNDSTLNSFDGSLSYGIAQAQGSLSQLIQDASSHYKTQLTYYEAGGNGGTAAVDQQTMVTAVGNLPNTIAGAKRPFQIFVMSYVNLPDWPADAGFSQISSPLDVIMTMYWRYDALLQYLQLIEQDPSQFTSVNTPPFVVKMLYQTASLQKQKLHDQAVDCINGKDCGAPAFGPVDLYTIKAQLPIPVPPVTNGLSAFFSGADNFNNLANTFNARKKQIIVLYPFDKNCYKNNQQMNAMDQSDGYPQALESAIANARIQVANLPQLELDDAIDYYVRRPSQENCNPKYPVAGGIDPDCAVTEDAIIAIENKTPRGQARLVTNLDPSSGKNPFDFNQSDYSGFDQFTLNQLLNDTLNQTCPPQATFLQYWTNVVYPVPPGGGLPPPGGGLSPPIVPP